ncbi:SRPBCC family protein [Streptomyces sp. NPDC048718]|uniref:SRPBCC family protein n=1 Tax=Streptomyces sp. NPDC048718 TaxID=3365587 RepID=UPI00370FF32C
MERRLSPVELDFVTTAPVRQVFTAELAAPPAAVYRSLAVEVGSWSAWFRAVRSSTPTRDGAGRTIRLSGGGRMKETIMAAVPDSRYVYRIDSINAPGIGALMEEWALSPTSSGGTRVRWTMATTGRLPYTLLLRLARPGFTWSFRDAMRRLDRRLTPARPPSAGTGR